MSETELAEAARWAWLWGEIEHWAFLAVVVALAIEFAALKFGAPYKEKLEAAKDIKIAELNNETARLRTKETLVDDALLANARTGRANALATQAIRTAAEVMASAQGLVTQGSISEAARSFNIIPKVKPFAGKQFDAVVTSSDLELEAFLVSLRAALNAAGWIEVERSNDSVIIHRELSSGGGLVKIHVDASKISELWEAAEALASALNAEGIETLANPTSPPGASNANAIHIEVSAKAR